MRLFETPIDRVLAITRTTSLLNVRNRPSVSGEPVGQVDALKMVEVIERVEGDAVSGNDEWYRIADDAFCWSGGCGELEFLQDGKFRTNPEVRRREDGTITTLSEEEKIRIFGRIEYTSKDNGAIEITNDFRRNLVRIHPPFFPLPPYDASSMFVHVKARPSFQRVFYLLMKHDLARFVKTYDGAFTARHMAWNKSRPLSSHSWGIAVDLNARDNGYGKEPAKEDENGTLLPVLPFFEAEGFAWGGHFKPAAYYDGMHFELARLDI